MNRIVQICTIAALAVCLSTAIAKGQPAVAAATGLRVIEVVDPGTGQRAREVAADLTPAEIARVQRGLSSAGFHPGRATGLLTAETRLALGRFQASRGLDRCECVSYETLIALRIRPFVVATIVAPLAVRHASDVVWIDAGHVYRRSHGFGHTAAVIVGHGPSVFVGHEPARGAGQLRRPLPRSPRTPIHDPRPSRPRPGPGISGSGAELRPLAPARPQPRAPIQRSVAAP